MGINFKGFMIAILLTTAIVYTAGESQSKPSGKNADDLKIPTAFFEGKK